MKPHIMYAVVDRQGRIVVTGGRAFIFTTERAATETAKEECYRCKVMPVSIQANVGLESPIGQELQKIVKGKR